MLEKSLSVAWSSFDQVAVSCALRASKLGLDIMDLEAHQVARFTLITLSDWDSLEESFQNAHYRLVET